MPSVSGTSAGATLSLQQQRLWLLDQLSAGNPACNIAVRWKLLGALDARIVERSIAEIVRRHESLRTKFVLEDYSPVQMVESEVGAALTVIDLEQTAASERAAKLEELCLSEAQRPFELLRVPLFRATLIRVDEQTHWLLLTVHHIVADGWSIGVFVDELAALYNAYEANQPSPLAPPPLQYRDYARQQSDGGRSNVSSPQLLYWLRQLKDLPRFEVPSDKPRPAVQSANGAIASILLPRALSDAVEKLSRANGATLFMTSLAALSVLLQRYTGGETVVMGTPVTGRSALELENLIGLFINLIVLRVDMSGDPSFEQLLGRTRRVVLDGLANEEAPFERLVDLLKPKRDLSRNPLFGVNFIFQRAFIREQPLGRARIIDVPSASAGALYDLNFFMVGRDEGWRISCEYNTDLYESATVQIMLERFRGLLETIVKEPARRISELSWTEAEAAPRRIAPPIEAAADPTVARPVVAARAAPPADGIPVGFSATIAGLIPLWEEVLGIRPVGQGDDFFELGGNSIQAARLMAKVNSVLGRKLPLAVVIRSSTPERLARELEAPQALEGSRVLALQPRGRGTPFFVINAYSGFVEVARKVDAGHPILNLIGDDDKALSGSYDLYEEVSDHVSTILATQPTGPYLLGGYSAGGIMAYEVAQRLTARGHEVALLVLFDIANPAYTRDTSRLGLALARLIESLDFHRAQLRQRARRQWPGYVIGRGLGLTRKALRRLSSLGPRLEQAASPAPVAFEIRIQAARLYRPQPYGGPVLFFKLPSARLSGRYRDRIYGWGGMISGDFEVCTVDAPDHLRIFSGAAGDKVAHKLEHKLREAGSGAAETAARNRRFEERRAAEDGLQP